MALSMDSKLKELLDDPRSVAILEDLVPGITSDKRLKLAYNMAIGKCVKFPQAGFSEEQAAELERRLAELD